MKFFVFKVFTVMFFLFVLVPVVIQAEETDLEQEDNLFIQATTNINVYDAEGNIVGKLLKGTVLKKEGELEEKFAIQWNSGMAYIDGNGVQPSDHIDSGELNVASISDISIMTKENAGLYDSPELENLILTFSAGVEYKVSKIGENYLLNFGGRTGFVNSSEVELITEMFETSSTISKIQEELIDSKPGKIIKEESIESNIHASSTNNFENSYLEVNENNLNKPSTTRSFDQSDHYFKVIEEDVVIYDNSNGSLVPVGYLLKGQTYKRISDYGNWHQIRLGNSYGYVWEGSTILVENPNIKNESTYYKTEGIGIKALDELVVYDNTSGTLVPFGVINKGQYYSAIKSYGNNWIELEYAGRIGYVNKALTTRLFSKSDRYFKVVDENLTIFDNSTGSLVAVGKLEKDEIYRRESDYGNWHRIMFGSKYGYVWKDSTIVEDSPKIPNENEMQSANNDLFVETLDDLKVYDNSTGTLEAFGTINRGQTYAVISGYGSNWLKVNFSGRIGYIYKPSTTRQFSKSDRYFKVLEDNLGVFDNSTGSLIQIGTLKKNEVYRRVSDYGNWHQIVLGNQLAYVWKISTSVEDTPIFQNENKGLSSNKELVVEFLEDLQIYDNSSGVLKSFGTIYKGEKIAAISTFGENWIKMDISGRIGYVYRPSTSRDFNRSDRYFEVVEDNLKIYDNSSGTLVSVGSLNKNQVYKRISDFGNWHQVIIGNRYGYVLKSATRVSEIPSIPNESTYNKSNLKFKSKDRLVVYDNTSGSLVPFGILNEGETFAAISNYGTNWLKLELAGRVGYVLKSSVETTYSPLAWRTIVLDAGHGGSDPGAIGYNYKEKDLTLQTVLGLASVLEKQGANVILTRNADYYPTLAQRVETSNKYAPDIFISLHYNSYKQNPAVGGIETYYYSKSKDLQLANAIHNGIMNEVDLKDRGVRYGNFHVIRENLHPSVLLELGYLSNSKEESIIGTGSYQKQAINGIVEGLKQYFK